MIRFGAVAHVLGVFVLLIAAAMAIPFLYALVLQTPDLFALGMGFAITLGSGLLLYKGFQVAKSDLNAREGLLLTVLVWFLLGLFGSIPYHLSPYFTTFTDAFFESISGFTTTGATVLAEVEVLPEPLQFWRCFTHWLGGMGVVLLGVAILPLLSAGGMHLYRAEFSGAKSEKLKPRITEVAISLWRIYLALTVAEMLALKWAGMTWLDAICHSFSTLGTGGFSTRTASIAAFDSPLIEYIIILFMLLAGINFTRHYRLFVELNPRAVVQDPEVRAYFGIVVFATTLVTLVLVVAPPAPGIDAFRLALFQVVSIITTTGFATGDFELWAPVAQITLLALMLGGGCTGSSAGGLKVFRMYLLTKVVAREFKRMVERRGVFVVRFGRQVMPEASIQTLLNLLYLAFLVELVGTLLIAAQGADVLTSIAAVTACVFNIGPGLGTVGPAENYGHLPDFSKWVLSFCMIAGRLEFYTLIVIFVPWFWRK